MKTPFKCAAISLMTAAIGVAAPHSASAASADNNQQKAGTTAGSKRPDAKPIEDLQTAAQRLRDAVHALAKAPPGPQRNQAINDGNRALMEVNIAMANLPPDLLTAQADESSYQKSIDRLEAAAQKLRDTTHALAADPNSQRRNETIKEVNKALRETQQVMADVPVSAWTGQKTVTAR